MRRVVTEKCKYSMACVLVALFLVATWVFMPLYILVHYKEVVEDERFGYDMWEERLENDF